SQSVRPRLRHCARRLVQSRGNRLQQFGVVGRFLQESGCSSFQGTFLVGLRITRRQHDDRNGGQGSIFLQPLQHHKAISRGQSDVENDQVGAFFLSHHHGRETVGSIDGVVVVGPQAQI